MQKLDGTEVSAKIQEEVKKETPNQSIISKSIDYLKENASWIIPSLLILIKEATGV